MCTHVRSCMYVCVPNTDFSLVGERFTGTLCTLTSCEFLHYLTSTAQGNFSSVVWEVEI